MTELVHITASDLELRDLALTLSEQRAQTYLSEKRRTQLGFKLAHVLFELRYRNGEFNKPQPTQEQLAEFKDAVGYGVFND